MLKLDYSVNHSVAEVISSSFVHAILTVLNIYLYKTTCQINRAHTHGAINDGHSNPSLLLQTVRHLDYPSNTPSNLAVTLVVSSLTSNPPG